MTIGRFITGTFKFFINLVVVLVLGMSSYYIYGELTTLPPEAVPLNLAPEGTNFNKDPSSYLTDESFVKLLKGDYFVDGAAGMGNTVVRQAVEYGLSYYPYDFSERHLAEDIYANAPMTGINLWIGRWETPDGFKGLGAKESEKYGKTYYEQFGDRFDKYDYDVQGTVILSYNGNVPVINKTSHPKLDEHGALVAPSYHFDSLTEMKEVLYNDLDEADADMVIAYWYLRIGSQVDSYVQMKAIRSTGGGGGSGGMAGINLTGVLLLNTIKFNFFGFTLEKNATVIASANAKVAYSILGPMLSVADFKLSGWKTTDEGNKTWLWRSASGKGNLKKIASSEYEGPTADYEKSGDNEGGPSPTKDDFQAIYDSYTPEKTAPSKPKQLTDNNGNLMFYPNGDPMMEKSDAAYDIPNVWLCEFGMPADTFSNHTIDFRTIKSVELHSDQDTGGLYCGADIVCYSSSDGKEWEFVSKDSARSIADSIGGYRTEENKAGMVGYLIYTKMAATVTVWNSGLMRTWITDELWDASLADVIEAKVEAYTSETYSYDLNDILTDPLGRGISLPDQITELLKTTGDTSDK